MPKPDTLAHDRALFDAVLAGLRAVEPDVRAGAMFGCPVVFVGRRMAFCVYGAAIGAKVPEARARSLIDAGRATPFRPYGKPSMREWVQLEPPAAGIDTILPVLVEAVAFARQF